MSTHTLCFHGEIRKNQVFLVKKPALSIAMIMSVFICLI